MAANQKTTMSEVKQCMFEFEVLDKRAKEDIVNTNYK